jgi:hypothetical protein
MKITIDICYLCGQLLGDDVDNDHVPPKQFCARNLRRIYSPNLFTLPVHPSCNKAYQKDEDYFVHSMGLVAMESCSGKALWEDISDRYDRPQNRRIAEMVLKEFDKRPSGLILPFGKVAKSFNSERIWRVVWKIVRGLFFKEIGQVLPVDLPIKREILSPGELPSPEFDLIRTAPPLGQYPGVFDYRYIGIHGKMYLLEMLFWDRIIMFVGFHVPGCNCRICIDKNSGEQMGLVS